MSRVLCKCGGELSFTTDRLVGYSIEVCSRCGPRPLKLIRDLQDKPKNANHATRLPVNDIAKLSDEEMIAMLHAFAEKCGGTPRQDQWKPSAGIPSRDQYKKRFGSVKIAVELAGLVYRPRGVTPKPIQTFSGEAPLNVWRVA